MEKLSLDLSKFKIYKKSISLSDLVECKLIPFKTILLEQWENVLFYDYTPNPNYINKYKNSNYKLTFSRKEDNENKCIEILNNGGNVAVVFANELPQYWNGFEVINGDDTDLRYFDPSNVVVGLKAKGKAKKDLSGFVVA